MAEASRINSADDVRYPTGAEGNHQPLTASSRQASLAVAEPALDLPELPERAAPASNPALNRSAQAVGRGVGTAVAGVRGLPRQFDKLRSRIHLVGSQRSASLADEARNKVEQWREAAEQKTAEVKDRAELYAYEVTDRTNRRLEDFRQRTVWRINRLRVVANRWRGQARHWQYERPLQVIAGCAAAAFAAGVALRIWRSTSE